MRDRSGLVLVVVIAGCLGLLSAGYGEVGPVSTQTGGFTMEPITLLPLTPTIASGTGGWDGSLGVRIRAECLQGALDLRFPETLSGDSSLMFIDHYRPDMVATDPLAGQPVWFCDKRTGALKYEAVTSQGVSFSGLAKAVPQGVELEFRVSNRTGKQFNHVSSQMCLTMTWSEAFNQRGTLDGFGTWVDGVYTPLSETTPSVESKGRVPWVMMMTKALKPFYQGAYDLENHWWVVDQTADFPLLARSSRDGNYLVAMSWRGEKAMLMTNTGIPCLHAGPEGGMFLGDGKELVLHGQIYLMPNNPEQLLRDWQNDFPFEHDLAGSGQWQPLE